MSSDKYIHSDVENRIYSYWEKNGLFKPKENSKKFSIVIPPPNVTDVQKAMLDSMKINQPYGQIVICPRHILQCIKIGSMR